jgi:hypothetical protein
MRRTPNDARTAVTRCEPTTSRSACGVGQRTH